MFTASRTFSPLNIEDFGSFLCMDRPTRLPMRRRGPWGSGRKSHQPQAVLKYAPHAVLIEGRNGSRESIADRFLLDDHSRPDVDGHDSARPHIGASIRPRCRPERFADGEVFVPHAADRCLSHRIPERQRAASSRAWVISRLLIGRT